MSEKTECIYCGQAKSPDELSLEHIWPDALGGDYLPDFWRTKAVCRRCNSISGVFVDGAFIKNFPITYERSHEALSYLRPDSPTGSLPLTYLGIIQNVRPADGEVIDFWLCTPGANVLHIRNEETEDTWNAYAGGDPKRGSKKSKAGRVIVSFTSAELYWVCTALRSILKHFPRAKRFVTNLELPDNVTKFRRLDPADPQQANDLGIVREFEKFRKRGELVHSEVAVALHADGRFLAKLALAVGSQLFGSDFFATRYSEELRKGFREANLSKRQHLKIPGSGYLRGLELGSVGDKLRWPGGWLLAIHRVSERLALMITAPTGRTMCVQITDDVALLKRLGSEYRDGVCWLTVPPAQTAVGPMAYPEYLTHMLGNVKAPELAALEALRGNVAALPKTGLEDAE